MVICDDKKKTKSGKKWQIFWMIFKKIEKNEKKAPLEQKNFSNGAFFSVLFFLMVPFFRIFGEKKALFHKKSLQKKSPKKGTEKKSPKKGTIKTKYT